MRTTQCKDKGEILSKKFLPSNTIESVNLTISSKFFTTSSIMMCHCALVDSTKYIKKCNFLLKWMRKH